MRLMRSGNSAAPCVKLQEDLREEDGGAFKSRKTNVVPKFSLSEEKKLSVKCRCIERTLKRSLSSVSTGFCSSPLLTFSSADLNPETMRCSSSFRRRRGGGSPR